jgi:hypothetical protein
MVSRKQRLVNEKVCEQPCQLSVSVVTDVCHATTGRDGHTVSQPRTLGECVKATSGWLDTSGN